MGSSLPAGPPQNAALQRALEALRTGKVIDAENLLKQILRADGRNVAPGDFFVTQVNYTQGATKYLWNPPSNVGESVAMGATEGFGVGADCVYGGTLAAGNATPCLMTTAWEVLGAYDHYLTPQWHESFVGAYLAESYGTGVGSANGMLVSPEARAFPALPARLRRHCPAATTTGASGASGRACNGMSPRAFMSEPRSSTSN